LGVELTTHLHLLLRFRMHGAIFHSPNTSSWRGDKLTKGTTLPLSLFYHIKKQKFRTLYWTEHQNNHFNFLQDCRLIMKCIGSEGYILPSWSILAWPSYQ